MVETKIQKYLAELEKQKNIKVLLACETGSRAWGFPSPDSDYDIRLIYVHKLDWYLSLSNKKDTIERMFENNELDLTGWDLRKTLLLLKKSNAALLERIQSPIFYQFDSDVLSKLKNAAESCYSRIATIYHYLSMAKKFRQEISPNEPYKLKKFFYLLRSALVSKWIVEKEAIPPIVFQNIISQLDLDMAFQNRIHELVELKANQNEFYLHQGESELFTLIDECILLAEQERERLPFSQPDLSQLDCILKETIFKYDNTRTER